MNLSPNSCRFPPLNPCGSAVGGNWLPFPESIESEGHFRPSEFLPDSCPISCGAMGGAIDRFGSSDFKFDFSKSS